MVEDLGALRKFYNDHLHKDLKAFESKRYRLLLVVFSFAFVLIAATVLIITLRVLVLTIFLLIPWYAWLQYYRKRVKAFRAEFKPVIVNKLLAYIDPSFRYYPEDFIPKDSFLRAGIFPKSPDIYRGEDYIMGKIGDVNFELCELTVLENNSVKHKLVNWFEGIFFHANFHNNFHGHLIIIPRSDWQDFIPVIKGFTKYGGEEVKDLKHDAFNKNFMVIAQRNIPYKELLQKRLLDTINNYYQKSKKKVYVSFVDTHFYIGIAEPYELLEAHIFLSNLRFDTIAFFYQELLLFAKIVEDFDMRVAHES